MAAEWVESLRDQCEAAGVPFFFKQWGGVNKGKAGRELGGRTHDDIPERAAAPSVSRRVRLALVGEVDGWVGE